MMTSMWLALLSIVAGFACCLCLTTESHGHGTDKNWSLDDRSHYWDELELELAPEQPHADRALQEILSAHPEITDFTENAFYEQSSDRRQMVASDGKLVSALGGAVSGGNVTNTLPPEEMLALKELYQSLNGPNWKWSGDGAPWDFSAQPPLSPCGGSSRRWEGIKCTCNITIPEFHVNADYNSYYYNNDYRSMNNVRSCRVYKIYLSKHNLRGTLPHSLFTTFRNLSRLHLGFNRISGTLPTYADSSIAWSQFPLFFLEISNTKIRGAIPSWIGSLTALSVLDLRNNAHTFSIPSEIGLQPSRSLKYLNLYSNALTGIIPPSLCNLRSLTVISIGANPIGSIVPPCIGSLTRMQLLSLRSSRLTGPFPTFVSTLTNLFFLGLGGNDFTPSSLSSSLSTLTQMNTFLIYDAKLSGTIPSELSSLTSLQIVRANNNNLQGTLPSFFCNFNSLIFIRMENNFLGGTLPPCIGQLPNLQSISLYNNLFTGTIPRRWSSLSTLQALFLNRNQLRGNLAALFNPLSQTNLQFVDVSRNIITGSLPPEIFELQKLSTLATSLNCMTGTLPQTICLATTLKSLFIVGAKLSAACSAPILSVNIGQSVYESNIDGQTSHGITGTLPSCVLALPQLSALSFSGNHLSGTLPVSFGISTTLSELYLSHNTFTGTIPLAIQLRTSWQVLDLSFNEFLGNLNHQLYLPSNSTLILNVNRLSGAIPRGILKLKNIRILEGNYFSCSNDEVLSNKNLLPKNDPASSTFICGSDVTNLSIFIWIAGLGICAFAWYVGNAKSRLFSADDADQKKSEIDRSGDVDEANIAKSPLVSPQVASYPPVVFEPVQDFPSRSNFEAEASSGSSPKRRAMNSKYPSSCFTHGWIALVDAAGDIFHHLNANQYFNRLAGYHTDLSCTHQISTSLHTGLSRNIIEFEEILRSLRWSFLWMSFLVIAVYMPLLYVPLAVYFGSLTNQYVWAISAAFKQGQSAAISLMFGFLIFILFLRIVLTSSLRNRQFKITSAALSVPGAVMQRMGDISGMAMEMVTSPPDSLKHRVILTGVIVVNIVVVVGVNVAYLIATLHISGFELSALSFALSLFKIVFPHLLPKQILFRYTPSDDTPAKRLDRDRRNLSAQLAICLLNNIIIPCAATIVISPNCTRYVFVAPPDVSSLYSVPQCLQYTSHKPTACVTYTNTQQSLIFTPSFEYRYTCSATLLVSYVPVFVYVFFTVTFVIPIVGACMILIRRYLPLSEGGSNTNGNCRNYRHQFCYDLATLVLTLIGPVFEEYDKAPGERVKNQIILWLEPFYKKIRSKSRNSDNDIATDAALANNSAQSDSLGSFKDIRAPGSFRSTSSGEIRYFKKIENLVALFQILCVVVTFGLMFPPLCLMGLIAVFSKTSTMQLMIKQFFADANSSEQCDTIDSSRRDAAFRILKDNFDGVWDLYKQAYWIAFLTAAGFCSFFAFDTLGITVGASNATWIVVVLLVVPFSIYVVSLLVKNKQKIKIRAKSFWLSIRRQKRTEDRFGISPSEQPSPPAVNSNMDEPAGLIELTTVNSLPAATL